MLFDEKGQADTYEKRIAVARRSYDMLTEKLGFPPEDIIFDPNVLAVATGIEEHNNYAVNFIKATEWIKHNLPLLQGQRRHKQPVILVQGNRQGPRSHAFGVSLSCHKGRPRHGQLLIRECSRFTAKLTRDLLQLTEDVVLNRRKDGTERLVKFAESLKNDGKEGREGR